MYSNLRPRATAGVALLSASVLAITPVMASRTLPEIELANPAVALTAAIDPLTPVLELFNNAEINFANLVAAWLEAPAPVLQQVIANQIGYLGQLPDIGGIVEQMRANLVAAIQTPFATDLSTLDEMQAVIYDMFVNGIPGVIEPGVPPALVPLVELTTTYLSGALVGLAGLVLNPVLALGGSADALIENLTSATPDLVAALNTLINIPTAMVDAFLNGGQTINVTPLMTAMGMTFPIPGMEVELNLGGLLSPAGSMFGAFNIVFGPGDVSYGQGTGFIGSMIALTKTIAQAIGWDGQGNPLAPPVTTPPSALRSAADISLVTSQTVALDITADSPSTRVVLADATVDQDIAPAGAPAGEVAVAPAVSPINEEPATDPQGVSTGTDDDAADAGTDADTTDSDDAAGDADDTAGDAAGGKTSDSSSGGSNNSDRKTSRSAGGTDSKSSQSSTDRSKSSADKGSNRNKRAGE